MVKDGLASEELYLRGGSGHYSTVALPTVVGTAGSPYAVMGDQKLFMVQGGSSATGAGSTVWVEFELPYKEVPTVSLTSSETNEAILLNAQVTGSFQVMSTTASQDFHWMSFGRK